MAEEYDKKRDLTQKFGSLGFQGCWIRIWVPIWNIQNSGSKMADGTMKIAWVLHWGVFKLANYESEIRFENSIMQDWRWLTMQRFRANIFQWMNLRRSVEHCLPTIHFKEQYKTGSVHFSNVTQSFTLFRTSFWTY